MDELVNLISNLIKIPTVNPPGENLYEAVNFMRDWLAQKGISSQIIEFEKGWPILIAEKRGSKNFTILLNGHFDVVPIGDKSKWSEEPFSGKIVNGKIIGRGATDMKGGLGVILKIFSEIYDKLDYNLILTAVSDEETGGKHGSKYLAEKYSPNLVLIAEPSVSRGINIGEKGLFQLKLIAKGKTAHGSLPSLGENAIMKIVDDLKSLSSISEYKIDFPEDFKEVIQDTIDMIPVNDVFKITFNPGVIRGGVKVNVVPDYCEVEVDMRIPPGITMERALEIAKSLVKNAEIQPIDFSEPNYTSPKNEYVVLMDKVIQKILGIRGKKYLMTGATDGRFFRNKGIPVIVYGPGELGTAHSYNEFVTIDEINKVYKVYINYLQEINKLLP
jgi:succinyl-diaminopimelate desuccinylase